MQHELFERSTWTWGLSLIVLTIAIHSIGVVLLALLHLRSDAGLLADAVPPPLTSEQLCERLYSSGGESAWNDRHGRRAAGAAESAHHPSLPFKHCPPNGSAPSLTFSPS
jgi:hypothetical protein